MTTGRKRWWRGAAIAAISGGVVAGGWFGFVRATAQPEVPELPDASWTRTTTPTPAPTIAEDRGASPPAPVTDAVKPAGALLPVPSPGASTPGAPPVPSAPPVFVPPAPSGIPPVPNGDPLGAGPRSPDASLVGDKSTLPAVPVVPSLQPAELPALPALPVPPKGLETKPVAPPGSVRETPPAPGGVPPTPAAPPLLPGPPMPAIPPLPSGTAEPPKAPVPVAPPGGSGAPGVPILPPPTELTPSLFPAKPADPKIPVKPDSGLKPTNPGNTLNPTVAPAVPIAPPVGGVGRETPGTPVDRPKPPEGPFDPTDKYKPTLPPPTSTVPHHRDDTMLNITTSAAFAFLGGALLAAEQAKAFPVLPSAPGIPFPGVRADDPDKLKKDLDEANRKIADANKRIDELEKKVAKLTELLNGKVDDTGVRLESDPGAVENIKKLRNRIADLEREITALKTQTSLKPAIVPEVKPRGIVKVVNEYPVEISIVINDKSYRVAPNTKIEVEVPAGEFTYQLLQSGAPATKSIIRDKEPVTLRIK